MITFLFVLARLLLVLKKMVVSTTLSHNTTDDEVLLDSRAGRARAHVFIEQRERRRRREQWDVGMRKRGTGRFHSVDTLAWSHAPRALLCPDPVRHLQMRGNNRRHGVAIDAFFSRRSPVTRRHRPAWTPRRR